MNRPIRRVALVCLLMIGALLANSTAFVVLRQNELNESEYNRRVRDADFATDRGDILVGTRPVAQSEATRGRFAYRRTYADGATYAPITGFYSYDRGSAGLERSYNRALAGTDDALFVRRLVDLVTGRKTQGASVTTTIDAKAQEAAVKALGKQKGAVVAIEPKTGRILALVTSPTYDPNTLSGDIDVASKSWEKLTADSSRPLSNRASSEIYPPGSTFKLITAAAALENGYQPDTKVDSPTRLKLPGTETYLPNETNCGGTKVSLTQALNVSCNTAFAQLGIDLGEDAVREMAEAFGMTGERFEMPLRVEGSTVGDIENDAELGVASIGQQNVQMTPMQAAMVAAAVANDGTLMRPYLVDQLLAPDLTVIDETDPEEMSQPVSEQTAGALTEMMSSVVANGSGRAARINGVQVAGKTGTAENDGPDHNWFIGFAGPDDEPRIAVAVFVRNGGGTGGDTSAPIARQVMQAYLDGQEGG